MYFNYTYSREFRQENELGHTNLNLYSLERACSKGQNDTNISQMGQSIMYCYFLPRSEVWGDLCTHIGFAFWPTVQCRLFECLHHCVCICACSAKTRLKQQILHVDIYTSLESRYTELSKEPSLIVLSCLFEKLCIEIGILEKNSFKPWHDVKQKYT